MRPGRIHIPSDTMCTLPATLRHSALAACILLAAIMHAVPVTAADITVGGEYYIYLNIYEKALGSNAAGTAPALSAYGTNSDGASYIFVAESSGKTGYVLLRQKSTGRYLAASASDSYSMVFESTRSTDSRFCWSLQEGVRTYLRTQKSTGTCVGVDGANKGSAYVGVYYDKPRGSHAQYSVIPATGSSLQDARRAYVSAAYTNEQGITEVDYVELNNQTVSRSDAVDIHITANDVPITGSTTINLGSDRTWLIFDNRVPSNVVGTYLKCVRINGQPAVNGTNCRVAIYLNGAAVIPLPATAMTATGTEGTFTLAAGKHATLGTNANTMQGFTLRRGYMATLYADPSYGGWSRTYVADHADLTVTLPEGLAKRVSSVIIKPWQYLSKKGWGDTAGATGGPTLRATWYWSWNAAYSSTADMEFVPCRQHRYWPSASDVNSHTASAAVSINEPEHSEQHTSDKCTCGGTIDAWTAYTFNKDFRAGGGRVGSPQPTDLSYLTTFFGHVDNMKERCDFGVTHAYWDLAGRSAADYATWFVSNCKTVWTNTGRPLWLTEMEISASWNSNNVTSYEQNRQYLQVLLQKIDECPWIERYAIYPVDMWQTYMFYEANPSKGLTPAGQVYRDHRATFAYDAAYTKAPNWYRDGVKTPTLTYTTDAATGNLVMHIGNTNGDVSTQLLLQRRRGTGAWTTVATISDRAAMDQSTIDYELAAADVDRAADRFRVTNATLWGDSKTSDELTVPYIANATIVTDSKSSVPGWTCVRNAANGFTKATGDTFLEAWNLTAADMDFDYSQTVAGLPAGVYELSANAFNSTNGVSGAAVNGAVVLYAVAEGVGYMSPVTTDGELDATRTTTVQQIVCQGGPVRIGLRNIKGMGARWAGADNFALTRTADVPADYASLQSEADQAAAALLPAINADGTERDATGLIGNPACSRGTTDRWTVTNVEVAKGEAADGDAGNQYFNKWAASGLSSTLTQDVHYLPTGIYRLAALLRGSATATVSLTAVRTAANGETDTFASSITGTGAADVSGSPYKKGWQRVQLPDIPVRVGDQLTITIKGEVSGSGSAWFSADDVSLTWAKDTTGQTSIIAAVPGVYGHGDACGTAGASITAICDLAGRRIVSPRRDGTTPALRGGIYIVRGRKVVVR